MPRYRTEFGVVVDIPAEKAERIGGLTPVGAAPPSPRKATAKRAAGNSAQNRIDES